jgi:hypothetical protein
MVNGDIYGEKLSKYMKHSRRILAYLNTNKYRED